ncbi:uncharacterized protein LOC143459115 [Clavelina lepadiformis]|uniref:uncharacterized protein LOC143459115 n=1 Tax=Clavelina lepadiformis TaxID=159417 RepID=UPI004041E9A9
MVKKCNVKYVSLIICECFAISVFLMLYWDQIYGMWSFSKTDENSSACKNSKKLVPSAMKPIPPIIEPLANKELKPLGKASPEEELERIWNYIYQRQYHCTESKYLGGLTSGPYIGDGAYDLCVEKQFWPQGGDKGKCLVYSFGINNDFSFDDEMAKLGCEVHSFDPSMTLADNSVTNTGVIFHKIGISNEDKNSGFNGWKMRTLSEQES